MLKLVRVFGHIPHYTIIVDLPTQRLHSSSFLGLPCRILNINHTKELLLMLEILHYLKDPKLWELCYNP